MITAQYDDIIMDAARTYNVPFDWIKAVIGTESNFDPRAYRAEPKIQDASYGLMQILYSTAKSIGYQGEPEGLFDPKTNIMLGTKYLAKLIERHGMDFKSIYSAYNSGSPTRYLTSAQVGRNVERAVEWLIKVSSGSGGAATGIAFLVGAALYLLLRK